MPEMNSTKTLNTVFIKQGSALQFIDVNTIIYLERRQGSTFIYTTKGVYKTREKLKSLRLRLDQRRFFQTHKSFVVNLNRIEKVEPWGDRSYRISFPNTSSVAYMSRGRSVMFFRLLKGHEENIGGDI